MAAKEAAFRTSTSVDGALVSSELMVRSMSGGLNIYAYVRGSPLVKVDIEGLQTTGGVSPLQERNYMKCLDEELKYCTIGTGVLCGILCWAAGTSGGGVPAAIVVGGFDLPPLALPASSS